jgi:putative NADPH-quinone reductase
MAFILGINGSPRKNGNTATMIRHALDGAESKGAATETVHIYDIDFKGCASCFACKRGGGKRSPRCVLEDGLTPVLAKFEKADAIIVGSPVYIGDFTGSTRAFIERLIFPYISYEESVPNYLNRTLSSGIICTMGAPEERVKQMGFDRGPAMAEQIFKLIFGSCETISTFNTTQFDDYSKFMASRFDPAEKKAVRENQFPIDCAKAFDMGARFADNAK